MGNPCIDCGAHGCVIEGVGRSPGGQRTNGGCRHLCSRSRVEMRWSLLAAGEEIRRLRAEVELLRTDLARLSQDQRP